MTKWKVAAILLGLAIGLDGCTSLMATASGPGPATRPAYDRSLSQSIADLEVENTANIDIYKADSRFRDANVHVVSFYGTVLLYGQVPAADLKAKAEHEVNQISGVHHLYNQLKVTGTDYYLARASNSVIATRIKSRLMFADGIPYARMKVVVDDGDVYIMGKISHSEADHAVSLIKDIGGIKKIIKIVDYVDDQATPPAVQVAAPATAG